MLEGARYTLAVSHPTVIKAEYRDSRPCQPAGKQNKLTVATDPVLRTTNDYEYTACGLLGAPVQDANKSIIEAAKCERHFGYYA
jgi:hypothetical protein